MNGIDSIGDSFFREVGLGKDGIPVLFILVDGIVVLGVTGLICAGETMEDHIFLSHEELFLQGWGKFGQGWYCVHGGVMELFFYCDQFVPYSHPGWWGGVHGWRLIVGRLISFFAVCWAGICREGWVTGFLQSGTGFGIAEQPLAISGYFVGSWNLWVSWIQPSE